MLWVNQVVVLLPMTSGTVPEEAVSVCELGGPPWSSSLRTSSPRCVFSLQYSSLDLLTVRQSDSKKEKQKEVGCTCACHVLILPNQSLVQGSCLGKHYRMNWKKKGINGDLALAYEGDIMIAYAMCPLPVCYFWKQK